MVCHQQEEAIRAPHPDIQAPHAVIYDPTLATPESCIGCHQMDILPFTKVERPLTDSHGEWEEWKARSGRNEDCLDCHMPAITRPVVPGGIEREGRQHTFVGAWDEDTVRSALGVGEARRVGDAVEVDIENLTGHRFPSGEPARILWIRLRVEDSKGTTLATVEERLDRRVEGPGARERYDTTLEPLERRTIRLQVDAATSAVAHSAELSVIFDRLGNLDAVVDELAHIDLEREILLAHKPILW